MQSLRCLSLVAVLCLASSCARQQTEDRHSSVAAQTPAATPAGGKPFGSPTDKLITRELGIYSVLLREITYGRKIVSPDDSFIIKEQSVGGWDIKDRLVDSMLDRESLDAFVAANSQASKWEHYFDVYVDYKVVPAADIPVVGSTEFKMKFPRAKCVLGLSKAGFNRTWTQALTMTEIECEQTAKRMIYWLIYNDEHGIATVKQLAQF